MPERVYVSLCNGRRSRYANSLMRNRYYARAPFFATAILMLFALLAVFPMPFYSGMASAGPGTTKLSDTQITLTSSTNETTVILNPGAGFNLSTAADTATYDVLSNNFSGYTLKIKANDDAGTLVNTEDSTKIIDSITAPIEQSSFIPATASLMNRWGIKPNKYYDTANNITIVNTTKILPAPTTIGTILDKTTAANSTANSYDIALGAMVDGSLPAGTYIRNATLEVVANPIYYTLTYNKNTADTVTNLPPADVGSTTDSKIPISSTVPERDHYAFIGWCLGTTSTTDNVDSCNGITFQPGDDFGIDQTTANITTLYAMWAIDTVTVELTAGTGIDTVAITGSGVKTGGAAGATSTAEVYYNSEITITATPSTGYIFVDWTGDATYTNNPETIANVTSDLELTANAEQVDIMQNLDPSLCTTTATSLVDVRDNQSYTIQRLADGQCWMTTSLNLVGGTKLYSETSDVPAGYSESSEMPYYTLPDGNGYAGKFASDTVDYVYNTSNITASQAGCTSTQPCNSYYSWLAATAGGKDPNGNAVTGNGLDAAYSICPKGWRLPKSGNSSDSSATSATGYKKGDFYKLITAYGGNLESSYFQNTAAFYNNAGPNTTPNFLRAGYYGDGSFLHGNSYGPYWSSSSASSTNAYYLSFDNSYISSADNYGYRYGYPVRCILDETPVMQNISSNTLNVLVSNTGDSTTLKDTRDNQRYTVTKLADGNVWMTQNLRFTGTKLTPADTNVDSNITMNYGDLTTGNSYTQALIHNSGDLTKGVWYNFAAASAGTIASASSSSNATQDVCPAGWRLPTNIEIENIVANSTLFNPTNNTGYWYNGTNAATSGGYWYSSSAGGSIARYGLNYVSGSYLVSEGGDRATGRNLRCIYDKSVDMQNISQSDLNALVPATGNTAILRDTRDNELYRVTKLPDGNVWMTQNIRFTGTNLTPADSNVESSTTMSYGDLASGNTFDEARIHVSDNSNYGVWYNYAAASAGTITGSSNTNEATSSICPAGWRLPTASEQVDITNYVSTFKPIVGGIYYDNALRNTDYGYWWSSTVYDAALREYLGYNSASTMFTNHTGIGRPNGFYIRCIYDASAVYMQDFSDADAASMTTNDFRTLTDNRDDQTYKVAKLADGNIWMIDNLNLNASTITATELDSTNTNLEPGETLAVNTFKGWQTSSATATYTSGQYIPVAGTDSTSLTKNGTLYNYCAASAGTICSSSNLSNSTSDICPKGWRLPTGGSAGEYQRLYNLTQYNTLAKMRTPIGSNGAAFALPGYFNTGAPIPNTAYWTSMVQNATKAYAMSVNTTNGVNPANYGERSLGFSIRCIYNDTSETMQAFSTSDMNAMTVGETQKLRDSRDGQVYDVTKLSDGNVWMTRNLAIGCDGTGQSYGTGNVAMTLTPADSNVFVNYSMPTTTNANGNSYDNSYTTCDATYGAYYNYAAASAKSVTGSSNTNIAAYDICPAGWRLPTNTEQAAIIGDINLFNPSKEGYWYNKAFSNNNAGGWWSSVASNATSRYYLRYENNTLSVYNPSSGRYLGIAVRCIKAPDITTATYMQDITSAMISSTKVGTTTTLTDSRDNQTYKVTRLEDGKLWMQDNLNLDLSNATVLNNVNENNTNATATAIGYLKNGGGTASNQWAIQGVANWGYTPLSYSQPLVNTLGHCSTSIYYPCSYDGNYTKDTVEPNSAGIGVGAHKIGVYYNYCAATAGSYCYGNGNSSAGSPSGAATQDVCPAGWRLPTGGASGEYQSLCTAIKGSSCNSSETMTPTNQNSMQYKLSTTYSGNFGGNYFDSTTRQGTAGFYWASTYSNTERMGGLWVTQSDSAISPQGDLARWGANSIRCVSK